ncbi:hypothetical protein C8F01DRAFT_624779 [Mycena amicta]|nr:hypothetical protein C8F01DRAFT_624779 [Mycena amicta]
MPTMKVGGWGLVVRHVMTTSTSAAAGFSSSSSHTRYFSYCTYCSSLLLYGLYSTYSTSPSPSPSLSFLPPLSRSLSGGSLFSFRSRTCTFGGLRYLATLPTLRRRCFSPYPSCVYPLFPRYLQHSPSSLACVSFPLSLPRIRRSSRPASPSVSRLRWGNPVPRQDLPRSTPSFFPVETRACASDTQVLLPRRLSTRTLAASKGTHVAVHADTFHRRSVLSNTGNALFGAEVLDEHNGRRRGEWSNASELETANS